MSTILLRIISVIILAMVALARHTYYLYPNFNGHTWFINKHEYLRHAVQQYPGIAFRSMLVYFVLFGVLNGFFGYFFLFNSRRKIIYVYALLVMFCAFMYMMFRLTDAVWLFNAGSVVKNFVLSPVYTLVIYILFKFAYDQSKD